MDNIEQKEHIQHIKDFVKQNTNQKEFNKLNKGLDNYDNKSSKTIITNTNKIIDKFNEKDITFHLMLCNYIQNNKLLLVDEDNFQENYAETFIYDDNKLHIVNISK